MLPQARASFIQSQLRSRLRALAIAVLLSGLAGSGASCAVDSACANADGICDPVAAYALYAGFREVNVLVGAGDAGAITASFDGGQTWQLRATLPTSNPIGAVASNGAGTWVAVGGLNTDAEIYYSSDAGRVWQAASVPASVGQLNEVIYNADAGFFIAMGFASPIAVSEDGVQWQSVVISGVDRIRALIQVGTSFYATGGLTPFVFLRSSNGTDWTPTGGVPSAVPFDVVGTTDGRFVTCGTLGTRSSRSLDGGVSWLAPTTNPANPMQTIALLGDRYLCAGVSGDVVASTDGGDNWSTLTTLPTGINALRLTADGAVVAAGDAGSFFRSTNGTDWSTHSLSISANINDLNVFQERLFYLYGADDDEPTF